MVAAVNILRSVTILLACGTLAARAAAPEIDWWRTKDAAVVELHDAQQGHVCSLFLYSQTAAAVVTWTKSGSQNVNLYDNHWQFTPDRQPGVALQIGDVWLGTPDGTAPEALPATAYPDHLAVPVQQPLLPLLRHAHSITAQWNNHTLSVAVSPYRMRKILLAVRRCRTALRR